MKRDERARARWGAALLAALVLTSGGPALAYSRHGHGGVTPLGEHGRRERAERGDEGQPPSAAPGGTSLDSAGEGGRVFLRAEVSEHDPFVGQQVVLTLKLLSAVPIYKVEFTAPSFEGLKQAQPFLESDYSTSEGGTAYRVHEYRAPLYVSRPGAAQIGPASFSCRIKLGSGADTSGSMFDDFYSGRSVAGEGRTQPIRLDARPATGGAGVLVGKTEVSSGLAPAVVKKGQPATLTVEVKTFGDDDAVPTPRLPGLESFQIIADRPLTEWVPGPDGPFLVRKVFKFALLGKVAGAYTIPPVTVPYVDPATGRPKEAASEALTLRVGRGLPAGAAPGARGSTATVDTDENAVIRSAHATPPSRTVQDPLEGPGWAGIGVAFLAFAGSVGSCVAVSRARTAAADPGSVRRRRALRQATRDLTELAGASSDAPTVFYERVGRVLREFLGAKLDLPIGVLTPEEIEVKLSANGLSSGTPAEVRELLAFCELKRWSRVGNGSSGPRDGDQRDEVLSRTRSLITKLESELSGAAREVST